MDAARLVYGDEEKKARVSDVERGRNEPQADTINRYCEALGIPYEDVEVLRAPSQDAKGPLSEVPLLHFDIRAVPGFTGREDLLAAIDRALWQEGRTAALTNAGAHAAAVKGLGGVGKSVLAREYAWRRRERYRGVWWVRAETEQTIIDDLIGLGDRIIPKLKEIQERDRALHRALDAIAEAGRNTPWLIVYDNVEKPGAIRKLTPKTGAHVLITSRWPRWQDHAQELPVDVFPEETAVDFLLAERPHETREAARRLADALGYLPLALSHARAYCAETNLSFDDYARRLSELIQEAPEDAEYPASIFATFSLAIAKAAAACLEAERLMAIAAFIEPERIPLNIITHDVMSEKQREKAIAELFKVSLVTHEVTETETPAFTVHRLVQLVMRTRLGEGSRNAQQIALGLMHSALRAVTVCEHMNWPHVATLLPHAIAILTTLDKRDQTREVGGICNLLGLYFQVRGDYKTAQPLSERALAASEAALGGEHPDIGTSLNNLASLYQSQGRYSEAEPLYLRALANVEAVLGPEHPDTDISLNNLALLYKDQGRYSEAEPLYLRALAIAEAALGPDHPATGLRLNNLATLYRNQGRYNEAEPLHLRAVAIAEAALGPEHPATGLGLNNLADLYERQGRYSEAEPLYLRALAISEAALGAEHPVTGTRLNNLANLYERQGRYSEAEPLCLRALANAEAALGAEHPYTGTSLNNLANIYRSQDRYSEAEPLYLRALANTEAALGAEHPETGLRLWHLADLRRRQERPVEAEGLYKRALKIFEKRLGTAHPYTTRCHEHLRACSKR